MNIFVFITGFIVGSMCYIVGFYFGRRYIIKKTYNFLRKINRGQQIPRYDEFINNK